MDEMTMAEVGDIHNAIISPIHFSLSLNWNIPVSQSPYTGHTWRFLCCSLITRILHVTRRMKILGNISLGYQRFKTVETFKYFTSNCQVGRKQQQQQSPDQEQVSSFWPFSPIFDWLIFEIALQYRLFQGSTGCYKILVPVQLLNTI